MADIKISGLAGAAAFAPSTTQEFGINDAGTSHKVSAAQIAAYFPNGTQGSSWYAQVTANQLGVGNLVDITGLTVTVTPLSGSRRLRISSFVPYTKHTAGTLALYIFEGATQLQQWIQSALDGNSYTGMASVIVTPSSAAHTYKLTVGVSAGTADVLGSPTTPAYILVEDLGT